MEPSFIHLRVHSAYSLSRGAIKVSALASLCKKNYMPAVAVTDLNNLFGVMDIAKTLSSQGIEHIIGSQIALKFFGEASSSFFAPILLYATSQTGYKNLIKLSSLSYQNPDLALKGPYILIEHLERYNEDIICLTGGDQGPWATLLLNDWQRGENLLLQFKDLFSNRLYIELMRHQLDKQQELEPHFLNLALKHDLPIVATNDVYFADKNMFEAHDALLCIANGRYQSEDDREKSNIEKYFKSQQEMRELFSDLPEALENTVVIAKRCHFTLEERKPILPPFQSPSGLSEKEELRLQATDGLKKRFETHVVPYYTKRYETESKTEDTETLNDYLAEAKKQYWQRLESELSVIESMGFPGYFLIVSDFIKHAKSKNIPVGPGRGSGAGSLVAWALTITDIDPLRFSLIFERFLNPERVSMPDFDVDFCQTRRGEVIDYVMDHYGPDKIAQIITFGKMQARIVVRDVGRVLQVPYPVVDKLCRLIPNNPTAPITLKEAIDQEPALQLMMKEDEIINHVMQIGLQLEGLYRHASTHAAGVVIGSQVISDVVPVYYDGVSPVAITQINMKYIEKAGLLKFDFLGLKTLSVIQNCVNLLHAEGIKLDMSSIPLDDPKTFKLLCDTNVEGVFQLESGGMKDVLKKLRPDRFEDLVALVALYRPGPMDDIPKYLARKHGDEPVEYPHPLLQSILEPTYGVMVYQEQVMQIAQKMAGYSFGRADILRRAMGKKNKEEMTRQRSIFIEGAIKNHVEQAAAERVFDLMAKFASYGFNKSHSAPYALISYQTAFLKANYPLEFYAATASFEKTNTDKLIELFQDLKENGLTLLPPDINHSDINFIPENGALRYALSALKGVGEGVVSHIIQERQRKGPFRSFEDFASRVDVNMVNKRVLESLIASGALDGLHPNRKQMFDSVESFLRYGNTCKQDRSSRMKSLFGDIEKKEPLRFVPTPHDWDLLEKTQKEFDAIGFFLTDHPLNLYKDIIDQMSWNTSLQFKDLATESGTSVRFAAIILSREERASKNGSKFAFLTLSDFYGNFEVPFFSDQYIRIRDFIEPGLPVYVEAVIRKNEEGGYKITGQNLAKLEDKIDRQIMTFQLTEDYDQETLQKILDQTRPGNGTIRLKLVIQNRSILITLNKKFKMDTQLAAKILTVKGISL